MSNDEPAQRFLVSMNADQGFWRWTISSNGSLVGWCMNAAEMFPDLTTQPTMRYGIRSVASKKTYTDPREPAPTGVKKKSSGKAIKELMVFTTTEGKEIMVRLAGFITMEDGPHQTIAALQTAYDLRVPGTATAMKSKYL
jgi:hypothetical protein